MNKVIKIAVWLVLIIWGINQSFNMISQANTVENVVGFFLLVAIVLVSYKTRCFTKAAEAFEVLKVMQRQSITERLALHYLL